MTVTGRVSNERIPNLTVHQTQVYGSGVPGFNADMFLTVKELDTGRDSDYLAIWRAPPQSADDALAVARDAIEAHGSEARFHYPGIDTQAQAIGAINDITAEHGFPHYCTEFTLDAPDTQVTWYAPQKHSVHDTDHYSVRMDEYDAGLVDTLFRATRPDIEDTTLTEILDTAHHGVRHREIYAPAHQ